MDPFLKKFQRHKEDFVCLVCGKEIKGTGYTNHCPYCLHSRHVDVNPGDRNAQCLAVMIPLLKGIDKKGYYIVHQCSNCGIKKKNKITYAEQNEVFLGLPWDN